jgi:Zn-dependent protease
MDLSFIANVLVSFIALVVALSFHEAAHAFSAKWQGDRTAEDEGRLTLNPLAHMDPIGTVLLPLGGAIAGIPFILGWAKPVPVNIRNFKKGNLSHLIVAAAGPVSNFILCFLCVLLYVAYAKYFSFLIPKGSFFYPLVTLLIDLVMINAGLAIFNLIPLPPLDGSVVFSAFMPQAIREAYEDYITPYGSFILIILLVTGGLNWVSAIAGAYVVFVQNIAAMIFGVS